MSWLTDAQKARLKPCFPKFHGNPRVDDRRILERARVHVSDHIRAWALPGSLPDGGWLRGDRGHDASRFREALKDKGTGPCIAGQCPCRRNSW